MKNLYQNSRFWRISPGIILLVLVLELFPATADGQQFNVADENKYCDLIITTFVDQVMSQTSPSCQESDLLFPKPGSCSVFFKCVRTGSTIQPFVEYCAVGFNFLNNVCVPNTNSSDCPQYSCQMNPGATATNAKENELDSHDSENNKGNDFLSLPLVSSSTVLPAVEHPEGSSSTASTLKSESTVDSKHFMKMTQSQDDKSAGCVKQSMEVLSILLMIAISSL